MKHISQIEERTDGAEHAIEHDMQRARGDYGYEDDSDPYRVCLAANMDYMDIGICGANYDPERYENCEIGKCKCCDESERNRLFDKIANDRRHL